MTVGSLFAGIGGFDLAFERAGFAIRWQVEIDPYCRQVLAKHWPAVERFSDVRTVGQSNLAPVGVICGGFPCQSVSVAGKQLGQADPRWLWPEFARIIRELRPGFVVVENVPGLFVHGFGSVLADLAESGYDAEWDCLPAVAVGAPHRRDRIWLVAYQARLRSSESLPDATSQRLERRIFTKAAWEAFPLSTCSRGYWTVEPNVGRVANGVPNRVDRLKGLGNAIIPQIAEWIARQILRTEGLAAPPTLTDKNSVIVPGH